MRKNNENQKASTQGPLQQKHIQQLSLKVLVPGQTRKELGSPSDRKILKGAAFITLWEVIFLPTHRGKMNSVTNKTLTVIWKAVYRSFLTQIPCF